MNSTKALSSFFQHRRFHQISRWAVAGVFAYAGFQKSADPLAFADSIASFAILPDRLINLVALFLPPFEILLALAVATGIRRRPALVGLIVLLAVFMGALGSALARGIAIDCGCFGSAEPSFSAAWRTLLRDLPLLGPFSGSLWLNTGEARDAIFQTSRCPPVFLSGC